MQNYPIKINNFGYAELYEWSNIPTNGLFGKFVEFDDYCAPKIITAKNIENVIGVSTINAACESNDYKEWPNKYKTDEYGDFYMKPQIIAVGEKKYDDINELYYIATKPSKIYKPLITEEYDDKQEYIGRTHRNEWVRVNILGQCIIQDNGSCINAKYCTLYSGNDVSLIGTAVPALETDTHKWRILNRISDTTILIFYK